MGEVQKVALPPQSALHARNLVGDFLDCYAVPSTLGANAAARQALAFPFWAKALLALRNLVVAPFGLRTTLHKGETIGHFPVETRTEREVILGFDDRHLDFRISILAADGLVYGATWVRCHNAFGRFYLTVIMPFHILIMRQAMARAASQATP
ncbi:MAG: DUF2867 domain-containing protein [Albidovulum sp.]